MTMKAEIKVMLLKLRDAKDCQKPTEARAAVWNNFFLGPQKEGIILILDFLPLELREL